MPIDWGVIEKALGEKLDHTAVKQRKVVSQYVSYIEGWWAIKEANRIFGAGGWSYSVRDLSCVVSEPKKLMSGQGHTVTYVCQVVVTVGEVSRHDVGAGNGQDKELGAAHEKAVKEAVTDGLKRALRTFGNPFGLPLYDKDKEDVSEPERPETAPVEAAEAPKPRPDVRRAMDAQAPATPFDDVPPAVEAAMRAISEKRTLPDLLNYWTALNADAKEIASVKEVIAAKDRRKAELSTKGQAA